MLDDKKLQNVASELAKTNKWDMACSPVELISLFSQLNLAMTVSSNRGPTAYYAKKFCLRMIEKLDISESGKKALRDVLPSTKEQITIAKKDLVLQSLALAEAAKLLAQATGMTVDYWADSIGQEAISLLGTLTEDDVEAIVKQAVDGATGAKSFVKIRLD